MPKKKAKKAEPVAASNWTLEKVLAYIRDGGDLTELPDDDSREVWALLDADDAARQKVLAANRQLQPQHNRDELRVFRPPFPPPPVPMLPPEISDDIAEATAQFATPTFSAMVRWRDIAESEWAGAVAAWSNAADRHNDRPAPPSKLLRGGWFWQSDLWLFGSNAPALAVPSLVEFRAWESAARFALSKYVEGQTTFTAIDIVMPDVIDFVVLNEDSVNAPGVRRVGRHLATVERAVADDKWIDAHADGPIRIEHLCEFFGFLSSPRRLTPDESSLAARLVVRHATLPVGETYLTRLAGLVAGKTWDAMSGFANLAPVPKRPPIPATLTESAISDMFDPVVTWLHSACQAERAEARADRMEAIAVAPQPVILANVEEVSQAHANAFRRIIGRIFGRSVNATVDKAPTMPSSMVLPSDALVKALGLPPEMTNTVDTALRRFAEKNQGSRTSIDLPRKGEPHYVYRVADVWPHLMQHLPKWKARANG